MYRYGFFRNEVQSAVERESRRQGLQRSWADICAAGDNFRLARDTTRIRDDLLLTRECCRRFQQLSQSLHPKKPFLFQAGPMVLTVRPDDDFSSPGVDWSRVARSRWLLNGNGRPKYRRQLCES